MNGPGQDPVDEKALEGWDPAADRDPHWIALQEALREGEALHRPAHPADVATMRTALKAQLRAEGLLRDGMWQAREREPAGWLRTLLLAGGIPAQVLRLGIVAAIALVVARDAGDPALPEKGSVPPPQPVHDAFAATISSNAAPLPGALHGEHFHPKDERHDSPETRTARSTVAPSAMVASAPGEIRVELRATPGSDGETDQTASNRYQRSAVNKESARRLESYAADVPGEFGGTTGSAEAAPAGGTMALAASTEPRMHDPGMVTQADLLGDALERLQVIRLHATLKDDAPTLAEVRVIEPILSTLLREAEVPRESGEGSGSAEALDRFRLGEEAMADRRYTDALAHFREAQALAPRSFTGFLGEYMMAEIRYDYLEDYEGALAGYQRCLQGYPPEFIREEHRRRILERIELMTRAAAGGWDDLRLWTASHRADSPAEEATVLALLLRGESTSTLAAPAAERLATLVLEDAGRNDIDLADAMTALGDAVSRRPPGADTARIQFALAELVFRRAMDLPRATAEYRKALSLEPSPELRARIGERAQQLAAERLVPGAPDAAK